MPEEESRLLEIGAYTFRLTRNPDGTYKSEALPHPPNAEVPLIPPFGKGKVLGSLRVNPTLERSIMLSFPQVAIFIVPAMDLGLLINAGTIEV